RARRATCLLASPSRVTPSRPASGRLKGAGLRHRLRPRSRKTAARSESPAPDRAGRSAPALSGLMRLKNFLPYQTVVLEAAWVDQTLRQRFVQGASRLGLMLAVAKTATAVERAKLGKVLDQGFRVDMGQSKGL